MPPSLVPANCATPRCRSTCTDPLRRPLPKPAGPSSFRAMSDLALSPASEPGTRSAERTIALWLLACCAMVFLMVVIGGITRLTESGLSITQWKPISGVLPPLNDAQWAAEFDGYKAIPQYQA